MVKSIEMIGKKFGRLVVLSLSDDQNKHGRMYECLCDCGNKKIIKGSYLRSGHTISCGCYSKEIQKEKFLKHGMSKTRLYFIWDNMKARCYRKNNNRFKNYGEKGVIICDEWKNNFSSFAKWAELNGYNDNLSIDRIDNNGNYEPSNCKFSTKNEQMNNTSRNIKYLHNKKMLTLTEISREENLPYKTVFARLKRGWTLKDAIEKPIRIWRL